MFKLTRSYNWLIFSIINPALKKVLSQYAQGKMIDIGCGDKPYKEMALPFVTEHIGVDHSDTMHNKSNIDLFGDAYHIPEQNEYFDTILCTDVLEHLEEPGAAIAEAYRVLKTGGYAIYTVPFFWHLHEEPRDFYRYTKWGLKYLFEKNGFEIIEIKPLSGFIVTFAQELCYFLELFRRGGKLNPLWWLIPIVNSIIQSFAFLLNKIDSTKQFSIEYLCIARKSEKNHEKQSNDSK